MKVLLVNPPYLRLMDTIAGVYHAPLGLEYLASEASRHGFEVRIYDTEVDCNREQKPLRWKDLWGNYHKVFNTVNDNEHPVWLEIEERIRDFSPDVVGIQQMSCKTPMAMKIAEIVKQISPDIKTIIGAHHPTIYPAEVISEKNVDYIVRGEGEITFAELLNAIKADKLPENVLGISYKLNGKIIHNPDRPLEKNLDAIGYPIRELGLDDHVYPINRSRILMSSRGCPFPCKFCGTSNMWTKKVRYRSVPNVIEEMKMLHTKYGCRVFSFNDDSFTLHRKRTVEFCKTIINEFKIPIEWICTTRFDLLDEEMLHYMKLSGCTQILVGVEAGNERILQLIQKETSKEKMVEQRKLIKKAGISFTALFILGLPTETRETLYDTYDFIEELEPDSTWISLFSPEPNTELHRMLVENGKIDKMSWAGFSHENIENFYVEGMSQEEYMSVVYDISDKVEEYNHSMLIRSAKYNRDGLAIYNLGSALQSDGKLERALEAFTELIESGRREAKPLLSGAMFHRGEIYTALKRFDDAKTEFGKCLQLAPQHRKARESLKKLTVRPMA